MNVLHRVLLACATSVLLLPASAPADPPDHAPAHGYRKKQEDGERHVHQRSGVEIVFDSERGVSVVVGMPDVFFFEDMFYRLHEGHWQASPDPHKAWKKVAQASLPAPVQAQKVAKPSGATKGGPSKAAPKGGGKH